MNLTFTIANTLEEIGPAGDRLIDLLLQEPGGADAEYLARLAVEELLTNIIKYGYDDSDRHEIIVTARVDDGLFELTISDDGHAFDPTKAAEPDTTLPAAERPIGGLGLFLVRKMSDGMTYERIAERNVVTVRKTLAQA